MSFVNSATQRALICWLFSNKVIKSFKQSDNRNCPHDIFHIYPKYCALPNKKNIFFFSTGKYYLLSLEE